LKSKQPLSSNPPIFFIDRSLGKKLVATELRKAGALVEIHDDHFLTDEEDRVWLAEVGKKGWIVLTKDQRIQSRKLELIEVENHGIGMFVFTSAEIKGPVMAGIFGSSLPKMLRFIENNKKPFIARISRQGFISKVRL
jgi:hypothetical protein